MSFQISRSSRISGRSMLALMAVAALGGLSACASQKPPEPAPVATTPPPPPPQPMAEAPRPTPPPVRSAPLGPTPGSQKDFIINAGDRVYFDYDQYAVSGEGRAVLDKQADWLQHYPRVQVRIEGNCDERGTREYNLALGARRAEAVKAYLVGHGVNPARIATISYGKEQPVADGDSEDAYAKNRNAHTAITAGAQ